MKVYKAPEPYDFENSYNLTMFLGGSIEMGKAIDWQTKVTKRFNFVDDLDILNPRRDDWNSSWIQDPTPGTQFHEQVSWELNAQENSDIIIYNFVADTVSPITLLELGLFSVNPNGMTVVVCPKEYFRYGNVKVVCDRYDITFFEDLDVALEYIENEIVI